MPLILCEVGQGHKDEGHEIGRYGPGVLVFEPLIGSLHRLLCGNRCLLLCWREVIEAPPPAGTV